MDYLINKTAEKCHHYPAAACQEMLIMEIWSFTKKIRVPEMTEGIPVHAFKISFKK